MSTTSGPRTPLPRDLEARLARALDETHPRAGRLPVWVAACLGAGLLVTPACGKKEAADVPSPPPGLETALMNPDATVMEPELESEDPMDPVPGQMDPPADSMDLIPPPPRGADPRPGELPGSELPAVKEPAVVTGVMNDDGLGLMGIGTIMGGSIGPISGEVAGLAYGAPPMDSGIRPPTPAVKEALVTTTGGKLDSAVIRRVLRQHLHEVRYCYERVLAQKPTLAGRIIAQFVIGKTGTVETCKVQQHMDDRQVGDCLCSRVLRWRFPEPEGDRVVVTYTWTFAPPQP